MSSIQLKNNSNLKKYQSVITEVNSFENEYQLLSDAELTAESFSLQKQYKCQQNLKALTTRSFALTREASNRTLGLRHFDVQLVGGLVLNDNQIAEMKTGEGKTLVATLPATLNALTKKGVHIVTVNGYLANRDQVSMGQIYRFLGLDTGLVIEGMTTESRKENYKADITYATNYELAFDFLRDNTAVNPSNVVLRPFNYCIIDEVDSVLIDEAQTPIILSDSGSETSTEKYVIASEMINYLELNQHYEVDEKNKNVVLTEIGNTQIEKIIQVQDLYNPKDPWIPYILNALKANCLFFNNIHYIIRNDRVVIVDEFTGRIMPDRRWGEGLHQAIEAKEKLSIRARSETQASITYQNFFLMYPKLSGMTGTGKTAEIEFEKIYGLSVNVIPTFKPTQRQDLPDLIYKDQFSKWGAVARFCKTVSSRSQPILVGTTTIEKSEMLAQLLSEYALSYEILNARPENARRESEIIAQAGKKSALTIATNMAGRGTDIILGGNPVFGVQKELYNLLTLFKTCRKSKREIFLQLPGISQRLFSCLVTLLNDKKFLELSFVDTLRILQENDRVAIPTLSYQCSIRFLINELKFYSNKHQKQENQIVKNLGGLFVIGTERNDSRRIDNQLRGRCGRQGDPGTSRFFLSLDDNLLRLFGGSRVQKFVQSQMYDGEPLESGFLVKSLDSAQQRVEERAYEQRKNLFNYDEILNQQRTIVYLERRWLLENKSTRKASFAYGEQIVCQLLNRAKKKLANNDICNVFENLFGKSLEFSGFSYENFAKNELKTYLFNEFWGAYQLRVEQTKVYGDGIFESLEKRLTLINMDKVWKEHLDKTILLRNAVGWRGYAQKNPLTEYKREVYNVFSDRKESLILFTLYDLFRIVTL